MPQNLLIVEDDTELISFLKEILSGNGYSITTTQEGSQALSLVKKIKPDLVLLDLGLPDVDGETISKQIKTEFPEIPVIILTAKDNTESVVRNLSLGADDYITKPFVTDELLARIKARLRTNSTSQPILQVGDLELNTQTLETKREGKSISLTQTEFQLLSYLMTNKDRVVTREMILNHVWSYSPDIESRVVDVYIGYLRKKIDAPFSKKLIHSIRGFGYIIKNESN